MSNSNFNFGNENQIVFIDSTVENYQSLIAGVKPGIIPIKLAPTVDGVAQIAEFLTEYFELKAIHIVSHGSPGNLQLGNTQLNLSSLKKYRTQLQQWGKALSKEGEILLYGCEVAAEGTSFIEQLKEAVGVEIAASKKLTGSALKGGDWDLEITTGKIASAILLILNLLSKAVPLRT